MEKWFVSLTIKPDPNPPALQPAPRERGGPGDTMTIQALNVLSVGDEIVCDWDYRVMGRIFRVTSVCRNVHCTEAGGDHEFVSVSFSAELVGLYRKKPLLVDFA
jgi:hypothetical protein